MTEFSVPPIGITAYVPSLAALDAYQNTAYNETFVRDANGAQIKGMDPLEYMHAGLVEETAEPWDIDKLNPGYSRIGHLLQEFGQAGRGNFFSGEISDSATALHQKEFGDISWYLFNRLVLQGIKASEAVIAGIGAYRTRCQTYSTPLIAQLETLTPAAMFAAYSHAAVVASREAIDEPSDAKIAKLGEAAGILIMSMSQVVTLRLSTSYENILDQNLAKIKNRIANGTVFDKTGGDSR